MPDNIVVNIELFGVFQDYSTEKIIPIEVPSGATIGEIRQKLILRFGDPERNEKLKELSKNCVLSNEEEILFDYIKLTSDANLAVLAPICGG